MQSYSISSDRALAKINTGPPGRCPLKLTGPTANVLAQLLMYRCTDECVQETKIRRLIKVGPKVCSVLCVKLWAGLHYLAQPRGVYCTPRKKSILISREDHREPLTR